MVRFMIVLYSFCGATGSGADEFIWSMYSAKFNFGAGAGAAIFSVTFTVFSTITSVIYSSSSLDEHDEQEHEDDDPA